MEPFLVGRWSQICLWNFVVPEQLLAPHLPAGLTLERYQGEAHLTLLARKVSEARLLGVHWPWMTEFPMVELRFYVHCGQTRGTITLARLVPGRLLSLVLARAWHEPCVAATVADTIERTADGPRVEYAVHLGGRVHRLGLVGRDPPLMAPAGTPEHHFKEQPWSFTRGRDGQLRYREVQHPLWFCYPVEDFRLDLAWADVFGEAYAVLEGRVPDSAVLAVGSEVQAFPSLLLE